MEREQIIHMAREAGLCDEEGRDDSSVIIENHLKRFAELVIKPWADQLEAERKRFQELNDIVAVGMQHARADERRKFLALLRQMHDMYALASDPSFIRARGNT